MFYKDCSGGCVDDQKGGDPMDMVVWADWLLQMWGMRKRTG